MTSVNQQDAVIEAQVSDIPSDSKLNQHLVALKGLNCHAQVTRQSGIFLPLVIIMSIKFLICTAVLPLQMRMRPHARFKVLSLSTSLTPNSFFFPIKEVTLYITALRRLLLQNGLSINQSDRSIVLAMKKILSISHIAIM